MRRFLSLSLVPTLDRENKWRFSERGFLVYEDSSRYLSCPCSCVGTRDKYTLSLNRVGDGSPCPYALEIAFDNLILLMEIDR